MRLRNAGMRLCVRRDSTTAFLLYKIDKSIMMTDLKILSNFFGRSQ